MQYAYNEKTHIYHIYDYCALSKSNDLVIFTSEEEMRASTGRPIILCKYCQRKRDRKLEEAERKNRR